jgi:hypothetical protein
MKLIDERIPRRTLQYTNNRKGDQHLLLKYMLGEVSESSSKLTECNHKPILVADDEPFNIITVEGILNKYNIEID